MVWSSTVFVRLVRRALIAYRVRYLVVMLALACGVSLVVGVVVLTDSLRAALTTSMAQTHAGIDLEVRRRVAFDPGFDMPEPFSQDVLGPVRAVEGVASAQPQVIGEAPMVAAGGGHIKAAVGPEIGVSWDPNPKTSLLILTEGHPPGPGEATIDEATATDHRLVTGQQIGVDSRDGIRWFTLVGLHRLGAANVTVGSSVAAFSFTDAQEVLRRQGQVQAIAIAVSDGADPGLVAQRVSHQLPPDLEVVPGDVVAAQSSAPYSGVLAGLSGVLLGFAALTLIVAALLAHNTFAIVFASRARELALLRAVGASRRQLLMSVLAESLIVGAAASLVGLLLGRPIASAMASLLDLHRIAIDHLSLVTSTHAWWAAAVAGTAVSVLSSWTPARRATNVDPVALMRGSTASDTSLRRAVVAAAGVFATGAVAIGIVTIERPPAILTRLGWLAAGAVLLCAGAGLAASALAPFSARLLGAPVVWIWRTPGRLARDGTERERHRTARTVTAMMIGLAFVATTNVVGASIRETLASSFHDNVRADFFMSGPIPPQVAPQLAELPEVDDALGFKNGHFAIGADTFHLWGTDLAKLESFVNLDLRDGAIDPAAADGAVIPADDADRLGLHVGDHVTALFNRTGPVSLTVTGIYRNTGLLDGFVVGTTTFTTNVTDDEDHLAVARAASGVPKDRAQTAIHNVTHRYPAMQLWADGQYEQSRRNEVDTVLSIIRVLLGITVLAAALGIANTLALSVAERTREFGLLRAVGMTAPQLRQMVRSEALIIGAFGSVLGLLTGVILGIALNAALPQTLSRTLTVPVSTLAQLAAIGIALAVAASLVPALRASRVPILDAIDST